MDRTSAHHDHVTTLTAGCTLLLYTDGLVERRASDLGAGIERLVATLGDVGRWPLKSGRWLVKRLSDELLARLVGSESDDDVAMLAMRLPA